VKFSPGYAQDQRDLARAPRVILFHSVGNYLPASSYHISLL
jgi:hypothetical protein